MTQLDQVEPASVSNENLMCRFSKVKKTYDGKTYALKELDLDIRRGELMTCLGPSGSGKTTALMLLAGLQHLDGGEILFKGKAIQSVSPHKRNLGMVFQNYALFPHMTVAENIAFPLRMRHMSRSDARERVIKALRMVRMDKFADRRPSQLSGGQQQRVALARALVFEPEMILLDEPLAALDKNLREQLQLEIRSIHEELGVTMLYVTHDQSEALTLSDRIAVFHDGAIEQLSTPTDLYHSPQTRFVASFIGQMNFVPVTFLGQENGIATARLSDGGVVSGNVVGNLNKGDAAVMAIRPERLRRAAEGAGADVLRATVRDIVFNGNSYSVLAKMADGTEVTVHTGAGDGGLYAIGTEVSLNWDQGFASFYPGGL